MHTNISLFEQAVILAVFSHLTKLSTWVPSMSLRLCIRMSCCIENAQATIRCFWDRYLFTMTYCLFFAHLAHLFTDCDQHQLTLGSDGELALRQCMHQHFLRAALITCTRHVQQNVGRWLDARIGSRSTARRAVYQALFGDGGLTSCNDVITFDASVRAEPFARMICRTVHRNS